MNSRSTNDRRGRGRWVGLIGAAVLAALAALVLLGALRYGGLAGLWRRASAEVAALRPHPAYVPTPLPEGEGASAALTARPATPVVPLPSPVAAAPQGATPAAAATAEPVAPATGVAAANTAAHSAATATRTAPSAIAAPSRTTEPPPAAPSAAPSPTAPPPATPAPSPTPTPAMPAAVRLTGLRHAWQTWNNCGPATLAMQLSYFDLPDDQAAVAAVLRPHPDDKNVAPEELAAYARSRGLGGLARVNGTPVLLKALIAAGLPVLVETWHEPEPNDGMGHYRLLVGFDDEPGEWIAYDSYDAAGVIKGRPYEGIRIPYAGFDSLWAVFNRAYVVIYDERRATAAQEVLGDEADDAVMWQGSLARAQEAALQAPADPFAWFNLGSSLVATGDYVRAAEAYDRARRIGLPWRMLWYQFGPFRAYFETGRFDEVIALADATIGLAQHVEELFFWKGLAENALGRRAAAVAAWQQALALNPNYAEARAALASVGQ